MLYLLLYPLHTQFAFLNVFRYLSFRIIYAAITAFLIAFVLAPLVIRKLQSYGIGQKIRQEGPSRHQGKGGTPTMGGILILFAVLFATLLWSDLTNRYVWLVVSNVAGDGFSRVEVGLPGVTIPPAPCPSTLAPQRRPGPTAP